MCASCRHLEYYVLKEGYKPEWIPSPGCRTVRVLFPVLGRLSQKSSIGHGNARYSGVPKGMLGRITQTQVSRSLGLTPPSRRRRSAHKSAPRRQRTDETLENKCCIRCFCARVYETSEPGSSPWRLVGQGSNVVMYSRLSLGRILDWKNWFLSSGWIHYLGRTPLGGIENCTLWRLFVKQTSLSKSLFLSFYFHWSSWNNHYFFYFTTVIKIGIEAGRPIHRGRWSQAFGVLI